MCYKISTLGGFSGFHSSVDPEELFRKIFGEAGFKMGGFSEQGDFSESQHGFAAASEVGMNLTFQQAARGCDKDLELNVTDTCARCKGEKAEPGTRKVRCHHCNGTGMVRLIYDIVYCSVYFVFFWTQ